MCRQNVVGGRFHQEEPCLGERAGADATDWREGAYARARSSDGVVKLTLARFLPALLFKTFDFPPF